MINYQNNSGLIDDVSASWREDVGVGRYRNSFKYLTHAAHR